MLLYLGHSFPASGPASDHGCWAEYTTTVSSVSSTDSASNSGKKLCCYTWGTPSQLQAQPQTMVVGQSIPQQYPHSPAQTVPPTQVRNYVVILGALPLSPSLRPWLLGRVYPSILSLQHSDHGCWDHGCWGEYTTTVSSVSSTDSASHSGKKLCCYTRGTPSSLSPSLRPWLLGRVYHNSILSLQHRQCLPLR